MRIVIGEDSALFREGLARLLADAGHDIVARAADAPALVAAALAQPSDLVITDIRMPPDQTDDGARAARAIRLQRPSQPILLLSQHIEVRQSVDLVATGGFGYLLKDRVLDVDELLQTIDRVAAGGSALDPLVVAHLVAQNGIHDPLAALTPREHEVLALVAEGRSNAAIARRLWLTPRTVETHIRGIFAKLDLTEDASDHRRVLAVLAYLTARDDLAD